MTLEAKAVIVDVPVLLTLVNDPIAFQWLKGINPAAESLHYFYSSSKPRSITYAQMVQYVMTLLRSGKRVCLVLYGHPGVFAFPSHELIRQCRAERIPAFMLPGVSAEDCLFADLGVDPGERGCQSFEATDFILHNRHFDPSSVLILWQFGITGQLNYTTRRHQKGVRLLSRFLARFYGRKHEVVIYEAALYPMCTPVNRSVRLDYLPNARYAPMSTLFVPPLPNRRFNRNIARSLGLDIS
jgi:hypothetical protein